MKAELVEQNVYHSRFLHLIKADPILDSKNTPKISIRVAIRSRSSSSELMDI